MCLIPLENKFKILSNPSSFNKQTELKLDFYILSLIFCEQLSLLSYLVVIETFLSSYCLLILVTYVSVFLQIFYFIYSGDLSFVFLTCLY